MGICCGNARIAGSNQKNRWIVFFSQCAPQFSPSPTCTRVRKYRSTKVLPEFRTCTTLQRRAILCVLSYLRTTLYMYVVHVRRYFRKHFCSAIYLRRYSSTLYVHTYVYCTTLYESTFVRKYESTSIDTSVLPEVFSYEGTTCTCTEGTTCTCTAAVVLQSCTKVLSYESIENRKSCSVVHYQKQCSKLLPRTELFIYSSLSSQLRLSSQYVYFRKYST